MKIHDGTNQLTCDRLKAKQATLKSPDEFASATGMCLSDATPAASIPNGGLLQGERSDPVHRQFPRASSKARSTHCRPRHCADDDP